MRPPTQPMRPGRWQAPLVMAALMVGVILMAVQLWVLTVALDFLLGGMGHSVWQLTAVSGAIFAGGLGMLAVLRKLREGPPFRPGP